MTQVIFKSAIDTNEGLRHAFATVRARAARRRIDGEIVVFRTALTTQFHSEGVLELPHTGPGEAWVITFTEQNGDSVNGYYAVPQQETVSFTELTPIDPKTLEPSAEPDPAWWGALNSMVVGASVHGENLVLKRENGQQFTAGNVRGPKGDKGNKGDNGSNVLPTDEAIAQEINREGSLTGTALNAAIGDQVKPISSAAVYVEKLLPAAWASGGFDGGAVAAACANGGRVILPPGKIVVEQTINPAKTLILEGAGSNFYGGAQAPTLLEFAAGINGVTLSGTATVSSVIRDVHLSGTGGSGAGITINTGRVSMADIAVTGFGGHGILIQDPGNAHIIQTSGVISLRGNGGDGLHIIGQSNACTFIGLDIAHNGGWGIYNEGRSNEFIHPHILNNSGGAIWDNSIGNFYHFPYVEADVNGIKDKVTMGPNSTGGIYITGSYGPGKPEIQAAGGGDWTVIINGQRRRGMKLVPLGGPTAGNSWEMDASVYGTNVFRLRDATAGKDVLRATASLVTLPLPTRVTGGLQLPNETTAPGGIGGQAILFSRDNGAGKTELCIRFPTGVVQVLAIEA